MWHGLSSVFFKKKTWSKGHANHYKQCLDYCNVFISFLWFEISLNLFKRWIGKMSLTHWIVTRNIWKHHENGRKMPTYSFSFYLGIHIWERKYKQRLSLHIPWIFGNTARRLRPYAIILLVLSVPAMKSSNTDMTKSSIERTQESSSCKIRQK